METEPIGLKDLCFFGKRLADIAVKDAFGDAAAAESLRAELIKNLLPGFEVVLFDRLHAEKMDDRFRH